MTIKATRAELAQALSTVPDVQGFPKPPTAGNIGDAWPELGPATRAAGDAFMVTWAVRVLTPDDQDAAEDWWDEHWPPLYYALEHVASVQGFTKILLGTSAGDRLAYEITVMTGD